MRSCAFWTLSLVAFSSASSSNNCRNQPGDRGFPSSSQWHQLNASTGGRLISVIPSAGVCRELPGGFCPFDLWQSTTFRKVIPGNMDAYNFEQDYTSRPPSLCLVNGTTCGQGNVPLYGINVSSVADVQAGVKFASKYNIKLVVKASGHDLLGRSTARNSLMIWTQYLRNVTFTDSFVVNGKNEGQALTLGSGVSMNAMHTAAAENGVVVVGGHVADIAAAGGYAQGAGHSQFSPFLGLAADNVLQYDIVLANGQFVTANSAKNSDLFWAIRGGGAGSWGVVTSFTVRAFPMFNATFQETIVLAPTPADAVSLIQVHTKHIFDWDDLRAGQYFYLINGVKSLEFPGWALALLTYFPNATTDQANAALAPLLEDMAANPNFTFVSSTTQTGPASEFLISTDDTFGVNEIMTSRLIPSEVYKKDDGGIAEAYAAMIAQNLTEILGNLVAGGKVSDNANVNNAVNPKWRSAKVHLIGVNTWPDSTPVPEILKIQKSLTTDTTPILQKLAGGPASGAYSNEADVNEPNFQTTFFGTNYPRLLSIKKKYDPSGLFIVPAGVGSEEWDTSGFCRK